MSIAATDTPIRDVTSDQTTSAPRASIGAVLAGSLAAGLVAALLTPTAESPPGSSVWSTRRPCSA